MILSLPTLKLYKFALHGYCTTKYSRSSPLAYSVITRSIISKIWDGDCLLQSPMPVDCPFPIHCSTDISYFCSEKIKTIFEHLIREVSCISLHTTPFPLRLLYGKLSLGTCIYLGLVYIGTIRFGGKVRGTYVS